jgi:DNA polymerase elongation subunit (family B)
VADPAFTNAFVDGQDLVLLYRDAAGQLLARRRRAEWSGFFRREDVGVDLMRDLRASRFVCGISEEGEWLRVRWVAPEIRAKAYGLDRGPGLFGHEGLAIRHYEADVDPVRRYFADTGAKVARPRRCYADIETDSRVPAQMARNGKARVLCWATGDDEHDSVASGVLEDDTDEAEARLLEAFWAALDPYDQVAAWFGDGFDFPILRKRAELTGAKTKDFRRWLYVDHMEIFERNNKNSAESGDEKVSLKLEDVAQAKIGEGKEKTPARVVERFGDKPMGALTWDLWAAGGELRELMVQYCRRDVALLPKIERKTGYLALHDAVCEVCSCFPNSRSAHPTTFADGYMLRLGVERGLHFPTRERFEEETAEKPRKKFAGAWVMEPTRKGIVKDVHVADFSGMYPSIIESFNMSPETKRSVPVNGPIPAGHCRTPSTRQGFTLETPGILATASRAIGKLRKVWSKRQAELPPGTPEWRYAGQLSMGYKVVRNSLFGIAGSPFSRFGDPDIGEAITQTGVWLIQKTIAEASQRGIEAIYGDTDALHATNVSRERFAEFVDWCNRELYPPAIAACGCVENLVEIAYEKEYERICYVSAKRYIGNWRSYKWMTSCICTTAKGEPGALDIRTMTCRDCGLKHDSLPPPRGDPEIKGLEYKRGDASKLARALQYEVIERLTVGREESVEAYVPIVERYRARIVEQPLTVADVQLSQSISKSLKEYATKTKVDGTQTADLPHVQVGKILKERGEQVAEGTRIFYYVVDASTSPMKVAPAVDYAGECDRVYLWSSRVWPATKRVLEAAFPETDWKAFDVRYPKKARVKEQAELPGWNPGSTVARKVARKGNVDQGTLFELPPPAASSAHAQTK